MTIKTSKGSQDHDDLKPSPPKKLIIEKYKKLAEKAQKKQDCTNISDEPDSVDDCAKKQNEKSENDKDIEQSVLKEAKRIKGSTSVSPCLSESERKVQLTKKTIMQEKLFKLSCDSTGTEKLNKLPTNQSEFNKPARNYSRQQNYRSRMQNSNKSWHRQSKNQQGNKSNKSVDPTSSSGNSFESKDNKVFQNFPKQQDNKLKVNDDKSNKLVVPSNSLENSLTSSTSTISAASNVSSSQTKTNCKPVLHLKKPLVNEKNEASYYENHGRMEPMSWSVINFKDDTSSRKSAVKSRKVKLTKEKIEKIAARKDEGNKEFLNFVDSSTDSDTVFRVHNNLTQIEKTAPPVVKIKTNVDSENLRVTTQIKEKFTSSQLKSTANHVIDLIDYSMKQSSSTDKLVKEKTFVNKENSNGLISNQLQEKIEEKPEDSYFKKESKNILSTLLKEDSINTTKKQTDVEYDDDMFNFEKPIRNVTPSIKEDESSKMSSSAKILSIEAQEYFTKLKQLHKPQLDSSIDSDDLSLICTSEIDDLAALRGSTCSKFEAVTNKIRNSSTEDSSKFNQNADAEEKKGVTVEEKKLDTISNEVEKQLAEKVEGNSNLEIDLDSGLGLKDSFTTSKDECDSEDSCIIFHSHSNTSSSVAIEEISSTPEIEIEREKNITVAKSVKIETLVVDCYKDIDSDEEFDIVNAQEFGPCVAIINKLKAVAAAQKVMATGMINEEDVKAITEFEESNNKIATDKINKKDVKAIMGSEESNNEVNTQSESTNLETGKDDPTVTKDNISEKVETDESRDCGYPLRGCDNTPKICNSTTTKVGSSKRFQKMKNALQKYQKKYKTKDTGEGSLTEKVQQEQQQQEQQRPIDAQKNQSLRTGLILPRHQILKEILKQKLHLQCKPMFVHGLKQ